MRVVPEGTGGKVSTLSRPDSVIERLKVEEVDEHDGQNGLSISGCYVPNNCNAILLVMSSLFIVGGIILTVISYRPRDMYEKMEHYRDRLESEESSQIKVAAPIFLLIGVIMMICAILLYVLRYFVKQRQTRNPYQISSGILNSLYLVQKTTDTDRPMSSKTEVFLDQPLDVTISSLPFMEKDITKRPFSASEAENRISGNPLRTSHGPNFTLPNINTSDEVSNNDNENQQQQHQRRPSLDANFVINELPSTTTTTNDYNRGLSLWSERSDQSPDPVVQLIQRENNSEILMEQENFEFEDALLQMSNASQMIPYGFMSPIVKRDIACFPASTNSSVIPTPRKSLEQPQNHQDPYPLLGNLPQIAQQ